MLSRLMVLAALLGPAVALAQEPVRMDTVKVAAPQGAAGGLPEFEERRAKGGGKFLDAYDLRQEEDRALYQVLRTKVPGLAIQSGANGTLIYSRGQQPPGALRANAGKVCFVQVIVDGATLYQMGVGASEPPDFAPLNARDFDGIEYYSSASRTPAEYRTAGAVCGTLILWSRRR